jgi:hypothetical protein
LRQAQEHPTGYERRVSAVCTFFASAKPFVGKARTAQYNSLQNWRALGQPIILAGDDTGAAEAARDTGALHIPDMAKTVHGTPLLSDIFAKAQAAASTPLVCYINADILVPPSFLAALEAACRKWKRFLMTGRRWDIDIDEKLGFAEGWAGRLDLMRRKKGRLHSPWGLDYFAFPRGMISSMPPFAIGRPGWDGWLIWKLAEAGAPILNATPGVPVLHQNHGYEHVPKGRNNSYLGPEGDENRRLSLADAPDQNEAYLSTYRGEWIFDGERIVFDDSWGRWWWFTRRRMSPGRIVWDFLFWLLGYEKYRRLRALCKKSVPARHLR